MMRRGHVACLVLLAGLASGWLLPAWGADKSPNEASPAPETTAESTGGKSEKPQRLSRDEDYELFSVLVDTLDQVERNYVKDISRRELVEAAIQGVLSKLDPYSNYISPGDLTKFRTSVESQFGGIGIQIRTDDQGLQVVTPLVGTPAYRAGLQAGDRILEINGQSTSGLSTEKAVEQLKGEVGSEVTLKVQPVDKSEPRVVKVAREVVHIETVLGDTRKNDDHWDFFLDREKKIGYIRVTSFSRDTAGDIRDALSELKNQGLQGLILDLRFNPGGLLTSAIEVSDLFIPSGRIVSTEGRNSEPRVWEAHAPGTFEGFPMAVLVNRYSASASEIVAACLQDHQRAIVVGERTWGKGSVQNVIEMEGGKSALKLTTAGYKRPNGKNIHRFPDATEKDEWGVSPNDGYEAKLSNGELRELVEVRHDRDIVKAKRANLIAAAIAGGGDTPPRESDDARAATGDKTETPAAPPEAKPEEPTDAKPAATKPAEPPPAEATKPAGDSPAGDAAAEVPAGNSNSFVDRQLKMAVDYIAGEIAKAK
ncbi:MAG: PDZ domain-containing protein [Planctomycetaceae bacterium]|nr:PDZ domain-containing protein [Planctomycetaceae bacterium]